MKVLLVLAMVVAVCFAGNDSGRKSHHPPTRKMMTTTAKAATTARITPSASAPNPSVPEPSAFCDACRDRRNNKDHYADPTDCHYFFQCFFLNETFAIGLRRPCPPFTFWHEEVLQCLPEGSVPCQDICRDDAVSTAGCYGVPGVCSEYFVCSNSASYQFCCPLETNFDAGTCSCVFNPNCTDVCTPPPTQAPFTTQAAAQVAPNECTDGFGNHLRTVPGEPTHYYLVDPYDGVLTDLACAPGTSFDLASCLCDFLVEFTPASNKSCLLWLPLDTDTKDHSIFKFTTFLYGNAALSASPAKGSGSMSFNGGRMEIPGLKTIDLQKAASFCLFFECQTANCVNGGLLSNNNDSLLVDYSVLLSTAPSAFSGRLRFWHPNGQAQVTAPVSGNGWYQVCVTYDGHVESLYLNGALVTPQQPAAGSIAVGHCPYTVGSDQFYGDFFGLIDEVLICPFTFSQGDVTAHFNGDRTYFTSRGYFP